MSIVECARSPLAMWPPLAHASASAPTGLSPHVDRVLAPNLLHAILGALYLPDAVHWEAAMRMIVQLSPALFSELLASLAQTPHRDIGKRLAQLARETKDRELATAIARFLGRIAAPERRACNARNVEWLAKTPQLFDSWLGE
jgi:hypothetical protein